MSETKSAVEAVPAEPDEPCVVSVPASARSAAQNWCQGGVFTKVNVNPDANNFVVNLQLSKKTQAAWDRNRSSFLSRFRGIANELAQGAAMNVAFSIHDTDGKLVGGCVRRRSDREATCK